MPRKKIESKVLVWIANGPKGVSKVLIRQSGFAINAQTYLQMCIRDRLIPYIRENYRDGEYVFWPDLSTSHYANIVLNHLRQENITFVNKEDNPACVPEVRPIEDFWALLKQDVYAGGWRAETVPQLINRIKYSLRKMDMGRVRDLALGTKRRIDFVRRYGLIENR